jgi:O-antigen/teichoic acid export membrane protein
VPLDLSATRSEPQRSVAGNAGLVLASQISGNVGYMAAVLVLARALGPAGRGTVAFITVTAMITARVANVGLNEAAQVRAARRPDERAVVLSTTLVAVAALTALGGAVACGALALAPGARPSDIHAQQLAILAVATLATAGGSTGAFFLMGCGQFGRFAAMRSGAPWLYAALLATAWAVTGLTVTRAAAIWVVSEAVPATLLLAMAVRDAGLARPSLRVIRDLSRFGVRVWVGGMSFFLNARVDQVITGLIASEATLGVYAVAVNGSEVLFYLPGSVATALLPAVARRAGPEGVTPTLRAFRAVALVTACLSVLAAALGPPLIPVVFGAAYAGSVAPFLWLLPSALGYAAMTVFSYVLLASLYPGLASLGPAIALVTGVVLDLLLIPADGASGAAVAASAALLAGGTAAACAYRSQTGFAWRDLVPRPADVRTLTRLAGRLGRWLAIAMP